MNLQEHRDPIADPVLAAAMADLRDEVPQNVDWDRLRTSISERAAMPLARRRSRHRSFGARSFIPVALAASIAFALWIGPDVYYDVFETVPATEYTAGVDDDILLQALTGDHSEQELLRLVTGSPELLLAVAVGTR